MRASIPSSQLRGRAPDAPGPCSTCSNKRPVISEPRPCSIAVIGSEPGTREDESGLPFVGETGKELRQTYLPLLGVPEGDIYLTNIRKCKSSKELTDADCASCSGHWLPWEFSRVQPSVVIACGSEAARVFGITDLVMNHGFPQWGSLTGFFGTIWQGPVIPVYHPAAGLHSSDFMIQIRDGFHRAAAFIRGESAMPIDRYPNPDYALIETPSQLDSYLDTHRDSARGAADTETTPYRGPYCLSFALAPGTGRVIMARDESLLRLLSEFIRSRDANFGWRLHNGLYDIPYLRRMGIEFPAWKDTMIRSYHQADQPKGLKEAAWRHCGMRMTTFEDLVYPHWRAAWIQYLTAVSGSGSYPVILRGTLEEILELSISGKTKIEKPKKPNAKSLQSLAKKLEKTPKPGAVPAPDARATTILSGLIEGDDAIDFDARWNSLDLRMFREAVRRVGEPPVKSIELVPVREMVAYACADADATLRLDPVIEAMMSTEAILERGGR